MSTFTHILEEGQNAANFIFDKITDTGHGFSAGSPIQFPLGFGATTFDDAG